MKRDRIHKMELQSVRTKYF